MGHLQDLHGQHEVLPEQYDLRDLHLQHDGRQVLVGYLLCVEQVLPASVLQVQFVDQEVRVQVPPHVRKGAAAFRAAGVLGLLRLVQQHVESLHLGVVEHLQDVLQQPVLQAGELVERRVLHQAVVVVVVAVVSCSTRLRPS